MSKDFIEDVDVATALTSDASVRDNEILARQVAAALASPESTNADAARIDRVRQAFGEEELRRWLSAFDGLPNLVGTVYQVAILTQELSQVSVLTAATSALTVPPAVATELEQEGYQSLDEYGLRALAAQLLRAMRSGDLERAHELAVAACDFVSQAAAGLGDVGVELAGVFQEYRRHLQIDVKAAVEELRSARADAEV